MPLIAPVDMRIDLENGKRLPIDECFDEGDGNRVIAADHQRYRALGENGAGALGDQPPVARTILGLGGQIAEVGNTKSLVTEQLSIEIEIPGLSEFGIAGERLPQCIAAAGMNPVVDALVGSAVRCGEDRRIEALG